MILLADSEAPDRTARMCMLVWAFSLRIKPKDTISHGAAHFFSFLFFLFYENNSDEYYQTDILENPLLIGYNNERHMLSNGTFMTKYTDGR